MERDKVIEILLALLIVIALLILISVFFVLENQSSKKIVTSNVVNSYNANTNYVYAKPIATKYYKPVKIYSNSYSGETDYRRNLRVYHSRVEHKIFDGVFGNDVEKYVVYVKNIDDEPQYFTVEFHFKDLSGEILIDSMTKYIQPRDEKSFFYQTIFGEEIKNWDYKVFVE